MKKLLSLLLLISFMGMIFSCSKSEKETPKVLPTSVIIDASTAILKLNETKQLTASVLPAEAEGTIVWASSDVAVASVSETGLVTALKAGTANITVSIGTLVDTCKVTVMQNDVEVSIKLDAETASINLGLTKQLKATVAPEEMQNSIVWSTSDAAIATVSDKGLVTGVKAGTADITAKVGEVVATCKVTIVEVAVSAYPLGKAFVGVGTGSETAGTAEYDWWTDCESEYTFTFVKDVSENVCQFKIKGFWAPQLEAQDNNTWKKSDDDIVEYHDVLVTIDASDPSNPTISAEAGQNAFSFNGKAYTLRKMDKVKIKTLDIPNKIIKFDYSVMVDWASAYDFHLTVTF